MTEDTYVSKRIALKRLGISHMTLIRLAENNQIEFIKTTGGHRKYNVNKYIDDNKQSIENNDIDDGTTNTVTDKINICYVRVSTSNQKDDLKRQKNYMKKKYPTYTIIEDIGSGINFNRKGFRKIIDMAIDGKINTLVVAYKDRLTRFGFEFIEDLVKKYSGGTVIIEDDNGHKKEPKEELVDDVMQILNVYTAKMNGLRKYGKL
jgi:putative resolvase